MEITVEKCRRKSMVLTVTREGKAVVRVPLGADSAQIEAFVARHRRWLERRLAEANAEVPSLENGSCLVLFGVRYVIEEGRPQLRNGTLCLPAKDRECALAALLKRHAAEHMGELTRRFAERCGFSYAAVRITSARTRWSSCGRKGNICYSFRTAFLPEDAAEYIAVHELCHTRYFNHGAAFWREVARVLPDYARRRKLVRGCEWAMRFL